MLKPDIFIIIRIRWSRSSRAVSNVPINHGMNVQPNPTRARSSNEASKPFEAKAWKIAQGKVMRKTIFESVSVKPLGNSIVRATTKPSAMMAVSEATVKRAFSIAPMIAPQEDDLAKNLERILLNYGSKLRFANAPYSSESL